MRRRLDFEEGGSSTVNRLPLIVKDVTKKDEEMEIKQAEKKLKTAKTFNNNNLLTAEKTLTLALAKALSRDQLLKLVSDLAEDPGRLASLLPRPDIRGRVFSLTYHMHNLHRAVPATRQGQHSPAVWNDLDRKDAF